ncbi:hypothetical protein ACFPT7_16590 [Acidicapsa dinghuensis]|uniref:Uncharacterized protein n=1 Tax=Acidicapsa dinghuensis TaxID=2218256 RepID=A0ABW1EI08_9BACT|nr:hypothetical protein [Acidicapsa dinghuensis]
MTSLGFQLLFWEGETFWIVSLLLVFPALILLVMLWKREVIAVHDGTHLLIGLPIFASEDRTTYASAGAIGTGFRTRFRNGMNLKSTNYGDEDFDGPTLVKRAYTGASIGDTWAAHQRSIQTLETHDNPVDRGLSFDTYVKIICQRTGRI